MDDILSAFNAVFAANTTTTYKSNKREGSYPYRTFDACRKSNRGMLIGSLIPPEVGSPILKLSNVYRGRIPNPNDENGWKFDLKWCGNENYFINNKCTISEEELAFNDKVKVEIEKYIENYSDSVFISSERQLNIFYMAIARTIIEGETTDYPNPGITLILHKSKDFLGTFEKALKQKIDDDGDPSWVKQYFTREIGPTHYFTRIETTHDVGPYKINVNFAQLNKITVNIDDSHLESSKDLRKEFINLDKYDIDYYKELYDILKSENDKAGNLEGATTIETPKPKIEDVDTVSIPETKPKIDNPILEDLD